MMTKFLWVLISFFIGASGFDALAANDVPGVPGKHPLRGNKIPAPAGIGEKYLTHLKESGRFRAIALDSDGAKPSPDFMLTDKLVLRAIAPAPVYAEKNKAAAGASNNDPSRFSVIVVPTFVNRKIMEMTNSTNPYPTVTMSWTE